MARLDRSAFTMLVEKARFLLMRIIVATFLFIAGVLFILLPFDSATLQDQANLLSWGKYLVIILRDGGESFAIGGAMLVFGVMVARPRRRAWPFGSTMPVSFIQHHQSATTRTLTMRLPGMQFSVRRMMAVVAVVAVIMCVLVSLLKAVDAANHGPYTTAFNQRCQELANRAGLVGSPESNVRKVLGEPTSVWRRRSQWHTDGRPVAVAYLNTTYNYAPCSFLPCGKFQVHCVGGVVESTEQLDD
jgi:hypothetical protein